MAERRTFDPIWEEKYAAGHAQRYPWDAVVSFVLRHAPRDRPRGEVRVLEVGCGTASNLWFAAREGFAVAGIDGSPSAIRAAQARFAAEGLAGDLREGDFSRLPFGEAQFDLAIDRAALTCAPRGVALEAIAQVGRALRPGGRFLFNPYSTRHASAASGTAGPDGLRLGINAGSLVGAGQICFWSEADVRGAFARGWAIESLQQLDLLEHARPGGELHAEWRCIARREAA